MIGKFGALVTFSVVLNLCNGAVNLPGVSPHSYKQQEDVCDSAISLWPDFCLSPL
jgi:hypothetical protein